MPDAPEPLRCPFCGRPESDRFHLEGRSFLVFPCQFTAEVDPAWDPPTIAEHLRREAEKGASTYFRGTCDRLHLYVTKGPAARELGAAEPTG